MLFHKKLNQRCYRRLSLVIENAFIIIIIFDWEHISKTFSGLITKDFSLSDKGNKNSE